MRNIGVIGVCTHALTDRNEAERMRLELQRQEQTAASEKAMREKEVELARVSRTLMVGELGASIAHEVNQPLAGVITNAEAGLRWLDGQTRSSRPISVSFDPTPGRHQITHRGKVVHKIGGKFNRRLEQRAKLEGLG